MIAYVYRNIFLRRHFNFDSHMLPLNGTSEICTSMTRFAVLIYNLIACSNVMYVYVNE